MAWRVELADTFEAEFDSLPESVQNALIAGMEVLEQRGPYAGRPLVDTLKGSRHANMKEMRFRAMNDAWRVAFAFDPDRRAIILAAGSKTGINEKRFYRWLVSMADARFDRHLERRQQNG